MSSKKRGSFLRGVEAAVVTPFASPPVTPTVAPQDTGSQSNVLALQAALQTAMEPAVQPTTVAEPPAAPTQKETPVPTISAEMVAPMPSIPLTGSKRRHQKPVKHQRATTRIGKRIASVYLEPVAYKQLHMMVIHEDSSVQDLLVEAVNLLFAKRGLTRCA